MTEEKIYEVVMPKLGMIMTQAQLAAWHKEDGDWVNKGEPLFDFESDKSTITIEAPMSGYVHLMAIVGDVVPVKQTVAIITSTPAASVDNTHPNQPKINTTFKPAPATVKEAVARGGKVTASPKSRVAARLKGISLEGLSGSGPRGMIVTADVNQAAEAVTDIKASPLARKIAKANQIDLNLLTGSGPRGQIVRADVENALETQPVAPLPTSKAVPLTGLRAVIAERLTTGWQERPQVTLTAEVDATDLVSARDQINVETGHKVSYNTFIVLAVARALRQMPFANVQLTGQGLVALSDIHIGVAVDTDRGLLVPVLRNADQKSLLALDEEFRNLTVRALEGKCLPEELSGSSLTITNLGAFGIDAFTPIINPPEAMILGVGRIALRPAVVNDQIVPRQTVVLSLSFDHRLMDGAPAARFLQRVVQLLERPVILISSAFL